MRTGPLPFIAILLILVSFTFACSDEVSPNENGFNIGEPTETDVIFGLENATDHTLYVAQYTLPAPGWLSLFLDGDQIHPFHDCGLPCPCDESEMCAVCGMPAPSVQAIEPGDDVRRIWNGVHFQTTDGCYERVQLSDEAMTAEFCWSFEYEGDEYYKSLKDPTCETVSFQQGVDKEVVLTVEEGPEIVPEIDFVLHNQLDEPVYIQAAVEPGPGWMNVLRDGEPIYTRWDCMLPCECPDPNNPDEPVACMDCGMMPPFPQELPAGEKTSYSWDGVEFEVTDGCFQRVQLTREVLEVEMCWGFETTGDEHYGYVDDPTCETVEFELGVDDEVVVAIESDIVPPHPEEPSINFVLENASPDTIYVQHGTGSAPSWLNVLLDGNSIAVQWDCGLPCPCDDTEPCAVCGMPLPWTEAVDPGEETSFLWYGVQFAIVEDSAGGVCYEERLLGQKSMTAEFCYGLDTMTADYDPNSEYVDDRHCQEVDFELGPDDEARAVVN